MTCRVVVRLLPILGQSVRERVTQPIRLILPDLFQDRLAKLTEHAAHVDMIISAQSRSTASGSLPSPGGCNGKACVFWSR